MARLGLWRVRRATARKPRRCAHTNLPPRRDAHMPTSRMPALRFGVGDAVAVHLPDGAGWEQGVVFDTFCFCEERQLWPYHVSFRSSGTIKVPADNEKYIRRGEYIQSSQGLRFAIGDRVVANLHRGWVAGVVTCHWWKNNEGETFPYQVCLDDDETLISAPFDGDECIMSEVDGERRAILAGNELIEEEEAERRKAAKKKEKREKDKRRRERKKLEQRVVECGVADAIVPPDAEEEAAPATPTAIEETDDSTSCIVCFAAPRAFAAVPCGHFVVCEACRDKVLTKAGAAGAECVYCRSLAESWLRVHVI